MRQFALDVGTFVTLCTVCVCVCVCDASRGCGEIQCGSRANGSATSAGCCDLPLRTFAEHASWLARKLSGLLILLALFAVGYFVQRLVCPRHRRRGRAPQEPESLLGARATASQDTLLERFEDGGGVDGIDGIDGVDGFTSPVLQPPAYDEVKDLPTYEESVRAAGGSVRPAGAERERPEAARIFRNSV